MRAYGHSTSGIFVFFISFRKDHAFSPDSTGGIKFIWKNFFSIAKFVAYIYFEGTFKKFPTQGSFY